MNAKARGFSLLEVVIFITIVSILAVGLFSAFTQGMLGSAAPEQLTRATQLAQERMELIFAQRRAQGFSAFTAASFDPCAAGCAPAPAGYTITSSLADNWSGDTNYKVITVTVSGPSSAQLMALVANY